ncbi:MBL fold metallo-hydrolase [Ammoniphilus oxalaticus]|uniref:MBL fold metallo-hydrolase n=1 Tax=Ammoniphilus oxalaticus TaxID=66863 RepID=A0A419SFL6_9BACL|nr:MBL fold metallo-hydrolase [Ammoniphilus oxalaticus]RKD22576.1 MBL fold metallo-hydrolase [Ammoniphilus oxalaticus]
MIEIKALASGSAGNCYHITDGETSLLLEAGIRYKDIQKALDFKTSDIAACLISHEHKDHSKAIKEVTAAGIDCYMSAGTAEAIGHDHHRIHRVSTQERIKIGTWDIIPFDVQHDVSEPYGFLLLNKSGAKVLFATDTYYIRYRFTGLTHIMVEANYSMDILNENIVSGRVHRAMKRRLMQSHFSLENVKEFLKANDLSKVEQIWLLHLSDTNSDEELFKREIQGLTGKMVIVP